MKRVFFLLFLFCFGSFTVWGDDPYENLPQALIVYPLEDKNHLFKGDGQYHLVYELFVSNFSSEPITLKSLTLADTTFNKVFDENALKEMFAPGGSTMTKEHEPILQPSQSGILFIFLTFPKESDVPHAIHHTIEISYGKNVQKIEVQPIEVDFTPPITIASPIQGDHWWAPNAASNQSPHRRAAFVVDGMIRIAQRFAVDWIQFDTDGGWYHGNPRRLESYVCYGKPVFAVADGKIVKVKDGIPDNKPQQGSNKPFALDTVMGNYIFLKINENTFALYAHLIPHSIKVKEGDLVEKGELLGLIGNSGNSTVPHLHFQMTNRPEILAETGSLNPIFASGIPFALDHFFRQEYTVKSWTDSFPEKMQFGELQEIFKEAVMSEDLIAIPEQHVPR